MAEALAVCVIDFSFDATVMEHQPFDIRLVEPRPRFKRTTAGKRLTTKLSGPHRIVTQWGERFVSAAAVAELRAALGSTPIHTVAWTDPDGTSFSFNVIAEALRHVMRYDVPGFYAPVILTFVERGS